MKRTSRVLILICLFFLSGCKAIINKVAFHPDTDQVLQLHELPEGIEELIVTTADEVQLTSLFLPAVNSEKLVIYFHGNAGNLYSRIPSLLQIRAAGLNVIGVGYRGYGKSEGRPSEQGLYLDGETLFEYAKSQLGFSEKNIFILGRSIGTTVAIEVAQRKDIAGLILVTPLTSAKEIAKQSSLAPVAFLAGNALNNLGKLENLQSPLLVVHGTEDGITPYSMGIQIYETALVEKQLVTIEGAGHNNLQDQYAQQYWPPILGFIEER